MNCFIVLALCACSSDEASKENECHAQAESRLALYNKPLYPITDAEKVSASNALYDECMRDNNYQKEVDTKNALPLPDVAPMPAAVSAPLPPPVKQVDSAPPVITAKNKPILVPLWQVEIQPYVSSDKELENILLKN